MCVWLLIENHEKILRYYSINFMIVPAWLCSIIIIFFKFPNRNKLLLSHNQHATEPSFYVHVFDFVSNITKPWRQFFTSDVYLRNIDPDPLVPLWSPPYTANCCCHDPWSGIDQWVHNSSEQCLPKTTYLTAIDMFLQWTVSMSQWP